MDLVAFCLLFIVLYISLLLSFILVIKILIKRKLFDISKIAEDSMESYFENYLDDVGDDNHESDL